MQNPFILGIRSAYIGSSIYSVPVIKIDHFILSDCLKYLARKTAVYVVIILPNMNGKPT